MTPRSDVTVLLARQRSGTNALRGVLETHAEICCLNEVFQLADRRSADPLIRASNYFTFLEHYCAGDVTRSFPDRQPELLAAFLEHLRSLTPKRLIVLDVKYNSTHHLTDVFREMLTPPFFKLVKDRQIRVLHLTRGNLLRCLISNLKAWRSDRYHVLDGQPPTDGRISLPPQWALEKMNGWLAEDELVAAAFEDYASYKRVDYTDIFPDLSGAIGPRALVDLASWFGVRNAFHNHTTFSKLSSLPLDQTIENIEEVRTVLRGTRFEKFLEDEPAYRRPAAVGR
ncbi:MAG TPA: hypothetical protein VGQ37_22455 [Vicinamibacterales bacterium]|jgi:hypothetical protein|nr:hypothetical protein [Vicinamibacterales bacterium]